VRVIAVESQPLFGSTLHWRIYDAKRGQLDQGDVSLDELAKRTPWDFGRARFSRRRGRASCTRTSR